jgi:hypothetical protein
MVYLAEVAFGLLTTAASGLYGDSLGWHIDLWWWMEEWLMVSRVIREGLLGRLKTIRCGVQQR